MTDTIDACAGNIRVAGGAAPDCWPVDAPAGAQESAIRAQEGATLTDDGEPVLTEDGWAWK